MSFLIEDEDKRIETQYWVYLEQVSLDFESSWTGSEVEICKEDSSGWSEVVKGRRRWVGPRSLEWVPSTDCIVSGGEGIHVQYGGDNGVPPHTSVIGGWHDVAALARGAEYQHGRARLEIKRDFQFGVSTVRWIVRKVSAYCGVPLFKLSVVIEDICRDEWNKVIEYQEQLMRRDDYIVRSVPYPLRENERVIEQIPKSPWQSDRSDVTNDVRHVALESLPLVLRYFEAESEAIQRGLSFDDFQWELPNDHETRVVCRPSAQTDTSLRGLRLDISIYCHTYPHDLFTVLCICSIDLQTTSITRSPSLPNNLSTSTLRLDPPYAALANATIPNHSSQIIEIPTGSQSADHIITTSTPIHVHGTLQIMGSVTGDMFAAPIYGGNVGGRNNTNHFTAPLTAEAVASAVVRALDSRPCDGGRFVPQTEAGRKRKRDDEEDIEQSSKRQLRPMSFISRFCAALFSP